MYFKGNELSFLPKNDFNHTLVDINTYNKRTELTSVKEPVSLSKVVPTYQRMFCAPISNFITTFSSLILMTSLSMKYFD